MKRATEMQSDVKRRNNPPDAPPEEKSSAKPKRRRNWRRLSMVLLILAMVLLVIRAALPSALRGYVNRTLDKSAIYTGQIGDVDLHLWRGAYSIQSVRIHKVTGTVPVPFFESERVDFAIQWDALMHGRIVGRMLLEQPEINFVDAADDSADQTGAGAPWLDIIQDLFPFRINGAIVRNGAVHFRAFEAETPVDVYVSEVDGTVENLTNIRDETTPLVATVQFTGAVMDQAEIEFKMALDPFSYRPTFQMATRVMGVDVTQLNDLARAYGGIDFEDGWLDLVIEAQSQEGQLTGYVKPLFRDLQVFSLPEDVQGQNILRTFWEALVGAVTTVLTNPPRDQFGTLIPFSGDLSGTTSADILATIGNVLRNAFVRAYLPRLEGGRQSVAGLTFEPPELVDPISVGSSP